MSIKIYTGARIAGISNGPAILDEIVARLERLAMGQKIVEVARTVSTIVDTRIHSESSPIATASAEDEQTIFCSCLARK